ncbi:nucleotide-diphospho-sugar transferases superfamily protein [Wolffia australiana]
MQTAERGWRSAKMGVTPQHSGRRVILRSRFVVSTRFLLASCVAVATVLVMGIFFSALMCPSHFQIDPEFAPRTYTILVNTYMRNDLLKKSVEHYSSCTGVDSIRVVWSEAEGPPGAFIALLRNIAQRNSGNGMTVDIKFDVNAENSLNNRFKGVKELMTDAVFSVDDDVLVPCTSLDVAFRLWQSSPSAMVGFVPRIHWRERRGIYRPGKWPSLFLTRAHLDDSFFAQRGGKGSYKYGGWWAVWWTGTYSMVLTKAAFFHRKYLDMYTKRTPAAIRDYVTKNRNCEDVAMSFLVANETALPPVWVKGALRDAGSAGISSLGGHSDRRSRCINDFAAVYGRIPLVTTSVKIVDARRSWFW